MCACSEIRRLTIATLTAFSTSSPIAASGAKTKEKTDTYYYMSDSYDMNLQSLKKAPSSAPSGQRRVWQTSTGEAPTLRSGQQKAHETTGHNVNLKSYLDFTRIATFPSPDGVSSNTKTATSEHPSGNPKEGSTGAIIVRKADECAPSPLTPESVRYLVVQSARRHRVDEVFAEAIAWAESDFDRWRNSPKGARGPMQLMPETAARFGVYDICDPAQNIDGAMRYLRVLFDEFQNPLLVAAAYNSGEHRIYEHAGIPPFAETVRYLAKVINYQLGLPMPSPKTGATRFSQSQIKSPGPGKEAGVIAVQKSRQFVGGVMHF